MTTVVYLHHGEYRTEVYAEHGVRLNGIAVIPLHIDDGHGARLTIYLTRDQAALVAAELERGLAGPTGGA